MARRLVALGEGLTALDAQQRTPLLVACRHRLRRMQGAPRSGAGLGLILALSSPHSTAVGAPMREAAAQGDFRGVACMARGGGADVAAMSAALPLAAAALRGPEVAALRLCGAAAPPDMAGEHPQVRGELSLSAAALLLRFDLTFRHAALLRILGRNPSVTAPALAAAARAAGTPKALALVGQAGGGQTGDAAPLVARRADAVLAHEVRPFLLCMQRLRRREPGCPGTKRRCSPRHPAPQSLPGSAVDLTCVFLLLQHHFLDCPC